MVINPLYDNIGQIGSNEVIKVRHHTEWVLREVLIPHQSVEGRGQERPQSDVLLHCPTVFSNIPGLTSKAFRQLQSGPYLKSRVSDQMNYLVLGITCKYDLWVLCLD